MRKSLSLGSSPVFWGTKRQLNDYSRILSHELLHFLVFSFLPLLFARKKVCFHATLKLHSHGGCTINQFLSEILLFTSCKARENVDT